MGVVALDEGPHAAGGDEVLVDREGPAGAGRTVGDVMLQAGRSLNRDRVRAGLAWWYRQYAKKDTDLARLEQEAREAKLGLWADTDPVPPWN